MQLEVLQIFVTTLTLPMHAGIPKTGKSTPKSCNNHPKTSISHTSTYTKNSTHTIVINFIHGHL